MTDCVDIIFAQVLDCYVEIGYNTKLSSIRFIKTKENFTEIKKREASFELEEYLRGQRKDFSIDCDISRLSGFAQKVLNEARKIKYGKTITYLQLARNIGTEATRAVGRALASNPIPIVIPCHRVVAKSGIGGYSGGLDIKTRLLELEQKICKTNNL